MRLLSHSHRRQTSFSVTCLASQKKRRKEKKIRKERKERKDMPCFAEEKIPSHQTHTLSHELSLAHSDDIIVNDITWFAEAKITSFPFTHTHTKSLTHTDDIVIMDMPSFLHTYLHTLSDTHR